MTLQIRPLRRWMAWVLGPTFALATLIAWAFASPIGAGPDDDFHLMSVWCADGGGEYCAPASASDLRTIPAAFGDLFCYAQKPEQSADCQEAAWKRLDGETIESRRGNFYGEYPPVYYAAMHPLAGEDVQASALAMRLVNAVVFVGLATALTALLLPTRRRTLMWGWLVTLVPLGVFLVPSNNPSGWAVTGVGSAFLALIGWFESTGRRRVALGVLYLVTVLMAAGARGDAAVYVIGATVTALILSYVSGRRWLALASLGAVGIVLALALLSTAGQAGVATAGFTTSDGTSTSPGEVTDGSGAPLAGAALAAYNLLSLPFLWTGVWGTWGLGWLDTSMPAIVSWAAVAAFVAVAFTGLGMMSWRKAVAVSGVLAVLVALPVYVLTAGGDQVGVNLQPRYLLPLIVLFAMVVLTEVGPRRLRFSRVQMMALFGALVGANMVALQVNLRRYVTGTDEQGPNLNSGAEWWWHGAVLGPSAVWLLGSLAFAALLAVLWSPLRRIEGAKEETTTREPATP